MLNMYAELLIELLTNRVSAGDQLANLDIDPELKCLLYECLRAQEKTNKQEQESYDMEIKRYIQQDILRQGN